MMKRRLTIPEGSVAIVLPAQLAQELYLLCKALRNPKRNLRERLNTISASKVASDILLELIDGDING